MKNYEKYEEKIREYDGETFCADFVQPYILKQDDCCGMDCGQCNMISLIWLMKEYEEPKVDWSRVEVDTPILVRQGKNGEWLERHFAKYENGDVYAWVDGQTRWTGADETKWTYAKLAEGEKECEEPKVDWSKVEVDTPILVRDFEGSDWFRRHFAKYENGTVYAWDGGDTSWSGGDVMTMWKYAKLAENEETK